ncbi:hypothetical protein OROGR_020252 [Orobanche gracilis]
MMKLRSFVKDAPDWRIQQSTPNFLGKKFYELLRPSIAKVNWKEFMMNNFASPKAKFILWLALGGRLATKERLAKFTALPDINCVFCNSDIESVNHITLNCSVVQQVWKAIMAWFGDPSIISVGQSDIQQMVVKIRGKKLARRLLKALITELIYSIWLARNKKIFQGTAADFNQILRNVVQKTFCRGAWTIPIFGEDCHPYHRYQKELQGSRSFCAGIDVIIGINQDQGHFVLELSLEFLLASATMRYREQERMNHIGFPDFILL